jgi:ribonuclease Z
MRSIFAPRLVNGPFGDPGLYVDFRDERRAMLFDLGDLSALPPRLLLRVSDVFVSHAHVDHFIGFDQLLRVILGRKKSLNLYGGPGFVQQVEHKLAAYTWNVVHRYESDLTFTVSEIGLGGRGRRAKFCSLRRFAREDDAEWSFERDVILNESAFRVRARFVDHGIPVLAFAVEEKAHVNVWRNRLAQMGLPTGPWLRALKGAVREHQRDDTPIEAQWRDRVGEHRVLRTLGELRETFELVSGERFGYVTDTRYLEGNVDTLAELLDGCDTLFIEAVFLEEHADHAARKNHLTARQAGAIARRIGARVVVPFHFSPRYEDRPEAIAAEVEAGRQGLWPATPPAIDGDQATSVAPR